jgi:K+-sensing histidine kinase KdpD
LSGFAAGVATGILVGVGGTFLILLVVGALTSKRSENRSELTLFKLGCVTGAILAIFSICHALKIANGVLIIFLLVAVITTAKLGGVAYGLVASSLAAVGLSWILPPDGSLKISNTSDRLTLAVFLLVTILVSRLVGRRTNLPKQATSLDS